MLCLTSLVFFLLCLICILLLLFSYLFCLFLTLPFYFSFSPWLLITKSSPSYFSSPSSPVLTFSIYILICLFWLLASFRPLLLLLLLAYSRTIYTSHLLHLHDILLVLDRSFPLHSSPLVYSTIWLFSSSSFLSFSPFMLTLLIWVLIACFLLFLCLIHNVHVQYLLFLFLLSHHRLFSLLSFILQPSCLILLLPRPHRRHVNAATRKTFSHIFYFAFFQHSFSPVASLYVPPSPLLSPAPPAASSRHYQRRCSLSTPLTRCLVPVSAKGPRGYRIIS